MYRIRRAEYEVFMNTVTMTYKNTWTTMNIYGLIRLTNNFQRQNEYGLGMDEGCWTDQDQVNGDTIVKLIK